jgi:large subunit ribosomal protein L16
MQFIPKKPKFKKQKKGNLKQINRVSNLSNKRYLLKAGTLGLKSLSAKRLNSKIFETLKLTITKLIKKSGKLIIHGFPNTPVTKKPLETRMGKGKGNVNRWIFKIKPGFILCEILTNDINVGVLAFKAVQKKLNIKTKIIFF